jgi:hypothetical protein
MASTVAGILLLSVLAVVNTNQAFGISGTPVDQNGMTATKNVLGPLNTHTLNNALTQSGPPIIRGVHAQSTQINHSLGKILPILPNVAALHPVKTFIRLICAGLVFQPHICTRVNG